MNPDPDVLQERCETCAHGEVLAAWRFRPGKGRLAKAPKIIECMRMPLPVLKLPKDRCGEWSAIRNGGSNG